MVRRHSLPPHALKRQNSRFKIGAGGQDEHDEPDPTAELKRLAEENAELRRQLAASAKGGDA